MDTNTARPEVRDALAIATRYGWRVFPVVPEQKTPAFKGWQSKSSRDPVVWAQWWGEGGRYADCLVGVTTGVTNQIWVLDVDPKNGGMDSLAGLEIEHDDWGGRLAVATPSGGHHFVYAYPTDQQLQDRGAEKVRNRAGVLPGVDVRGGGGLIVAPGQTGRDVAADAPDVIGPAPDWLLDLVLSTPTKESGGSTVPVGASQYTDLVSNPPVGEGGRNSWLTAVAGHLAVRESYRDAFVASVEAMNRTMQSPLDDVEVAKICKSIWSTELAKGKAKVVQLRPATGAGDDGPGPGQLDELTGDELSEMAAGLGWESGGLVPGRRNGKRTGRLVAEVMEKVGDKSVRKSGVWANFDMQALGVTSDDSGERFYLVNLIRARDGIEREMILPAAALGDRRKLNAWMAQERVAIFDPPGATLKMGACERLQQYLESQGPAEFTVVDHLGWSNSAGAFLTTEGTITPDGPAPFGEFRPSSSVMSNKNATYHYGHEADEATVRSVLNEILTFHYGDEAAVFGAWWAATLLKHVAMQHSALFPVMAIEAPSEAGKTTGMFGMLVHLSGWAKGQSTYTKASFRDALTVNRNGIVWLDDPDSVSNLEEVLRAATAEGSMTKKAEDLAFNQDAKLVAPVAVTGEALGFRDQKALRDRAIHLNVRTPTGRTSVIPGREGKSQWDDVLDFKRRHPVLSDYSGTLIAMALRHSEGFARDVRNLRGSSGRRIGDSVAILRAGARLLDRLTDDGGFDDQVGHWLDENGVVDTGAQNSLTLKVVPALLRHVGHNSTPNREHRLGLPTPVLVREDPSGGPTEVWVNTALCAEWWQRIQGHRVIERTETQSAFQQQIDALGAPPSKVFRVAVRYEAPGSREPVNKGEAKRYRRLPDDIAEQVLED